MLHQVFVYGTLKRGEPNEHEMTNEQTGYSRFIGTARSLDKYPLIVSTRFNIPFLLKNPGVGQVVSLLFRVYPFVSAGRRRSLWGGRSKVGVFRWVWKPSPFVFSHYATSGVPGKRRKIRCFHLHVTGVARNFSFERIRNAGQLQHKWYSRSAIWWEVSSKNLCPNIVLVCLKISSRSRVGRCCTYTDCRSQSLNLIEDVENLTRCFFAAKIARPTKTCISSQFMFISVCGINLNIVCEWCFVSYLSLCKFVLVDPLLLERSLF